MQFGSNFNLIYSTLEEKIEYTSDSHLGFVFFLQHDGRERKQGWFLDEVQVTNPRKPQTWTFPCYQWLSLYESDCQVRRSLKPLVHKKVEKVGEHHVQERRIVKLKMV